MSSERRASLLAVKLQALVREQVGAADVELGPFAGGAALVRGDEAWVLVEDDPARGMGGALAWAERRRTRSLNVLAEAETGVLARRAAFFAPAPTVWRVDGRVLAPAQPAPRPDAAPITAGAAAFRDVIEAAGAEPVVEYGVLSGEVAGLEVCRVVIGEDGHERLDVGIGRHDREAFRLVHGDEPVGKVLADVVAQVAEQRRPGARGHPLNRLGRERALRWRLVLDPALIGLTSLVPAPPPMPRPNLKDPVPCVALGRAGDGSEVVVVCSTGVDLDLVPFAADARDALAEPATTLLLAVPEGDDHPITRDLAGLLAVPARVVAIPPAVVPGDSPGAAGVSPGPAGDPA